MKHVTKTAQVAIAMVEEPDPVGEAFFRFMMWVTLAFGLGVGSWIFFLAPNSVL